MTKLSEKNETAKFNLPHLSMLGAIRMQTPVSLLVGTSPTITEITTLGELFARMQTGEAAKIQSASNLVALYEDYKRNLQASLNDLRDAFVHLAANETEKDHFEALLEGKTKSNKKVYDSFCANNEGFESITAFKNAYLQFENCKKPYDNAKKQLNGFIVGNFSKRNDESCKEYTSLMVFDLDKCNSVFGMESYFDHLKTLPYVFAAFPSASGYGLRVMVWTNATIETHSAVYESVLETLCNDLQVTTDATQLPYLDQSCKGLSRFFWFTEVHKSMLFLNADSTVLKVETKPFTNVVNNPTMMQVDEPIINDAVKMEHLSKKIKPSKPRNMQTLDFAQMCCENGVAFDNCLNHCLTAFWDGDEKRIRETVKDGYKRTSVKFTDEQFLHLLNKVEGESKPKLQPAKNIKKVDLNEIAALKETAKAVESIENEDDTKEKTSKYEKVEKLLNAFYKTRFNEVSLELEFKKRFSKDDFTRLDDRDFNNMLKFLGKKITSISDKTLTTVLYSDFSESFNPIKQYFNTLEAWDGIDHIGNLAKYVVAENQEWFEIMFKKMLVRSIPCGLGLIENKQCFTLFGVQNDGKTSFLRFLCPSVLQPYFKQNLKIDKDGEISLAQNLFINLDELDKASKGDLEDYKSVFTQDWVKARLPYGRIVSRLRRICNFVGSTNKKELLTDASGNVRWLILEIKRIRHDGGGANGYNQNINIDKVWSQAFHLYQNGFPYQLTKAELAHSESNNQGFKRIYAEKELIEALLEQPTKENEYLASYLNTTQIYEKIGLKSVMSSKLTINNVSKAMKELGFELKSSSIKGVKAYRYKVIEKIEL
jgi:predicted P-loop ATPase